MGRNVGRGIHDGLGGGRLGGVDPESFAAQLALDQVDDGALDPGAADVDPECLLGRGRLALGRHRTHAPSPEIVPVIVKGRGEGRQAGQTACGNGGIEGRGCAEAVCPSITAGGRAVLRICASSALTGSDTPLGVYSAPSTRSTESSTRVSTTS